MKLQNSLFYIDCHKTDEYVITFHPDHVIYHVHFPGHPITPGACIVQILGELIKLHENRALHLKEIKNLKFVMPISPIENPSISVVFQKIELIDKDLHAMGIIANGDKIYTKFSMIYQSDQR